MKSNIQIPRELLAQIDFQNTVNGGMANAISTGWRDKDGYRMILKAPSVDIEKIHIETANQRFSVFYMLHVLDSTVQMPYFLVNLPLSPEIDVNNISARLENDGRISIHAPFNDWAKGQSRHIDIDI